ncbi:MAG: hypothetical protein K5945_04550 [Bacteroidaceae bacterium]|nr:hypothetical protein [Bacteroidaceae bacterium]
MKKNKFWSLAALCFCLAGAFTMTACGDDDDETNGGDTPAKSGDLVGTWSFDGMTYKFTKDELTIQYDEQNSSKGKYTYAKNTLTYTMEEDGQQVTHKAEVLFLYDKSALVLKTVPDNPDDFSLDKVAVVLFKNGKAPSMPAKDIQGTWHWYMQGNQKYVRAGVKLDGNKIELIITPWAERHVGTFTYEGGYLKVKWTEAYSARSEDGQGWGEGGINPETLECDHWYPVEGMIGQFNSDIPFIANTSMKEAYGRIAGLLAIFVKK